MHRRRAVCVASVLGLAVVLARPAHASEGGASIYLLGSGGPEAAIMPPLQGFYLDGEIYRYTGAAAANRQFVIGGNVVTGVNATIWAGFLTGLWVPSTNVLGGTAALGFAEPVGSPQVEVDAVITGPLGNSFNLSRSDNAFVFGDPLLLGELGWKRGDHLHLQASVFLNVPVGGYREGQLANLAFHRWAGDTSFAATWHDDTSGWDLSTKAGFTFNGTNDVTEYTTGTEFHWEGSVEKKLSKRFAVGISGYWFDQVSGDSGPGAALGSFKGRVAGAGGTAAWNLMLGKRPAVLRFHGYKEFDVKNRLEGNALFLDLSVPISVKMPATVTPPAT